MRALIDSTDPLRLKFQVWCSSIVLLHGMYVPVLRIISVQDQCFIGFMVPEIELFLPAGRTRSARPAGSKITLHFSASVGMCVRTYHVRNNYVTYIVAMRPCFSRLRQFR